MIKLNQQRASPTSTSDKVPTRYAKTVVYPLGCTRSERYGTTEAHSTTVPAQLAQGFERPSTRRIGDGLSVNT